MQMLKVVQGKPESSLFIADTPTRQERLLSSLPFINCYVAAKLLSYAHGNNLNLSEVLAACKDAGVVSRTVCSGLPFSQAEALVKGLHREFSWEAESVQAAPDDIELDEDVLVNCPRVADAEGPELAAPPLSSCQHQRKILTHNVSSMQLPNNALQSLQGGATADRLQAIALRDGHAGRLEAAHQQGPRMTGQKIQTVPSFEKVERPEPNTRQHTAASSGKNKHGLDTLDTWLRGTQQLSAVDQSCPVTSAGACPGLQPNGEADLTLAARIKKRTASDWQQDGHASAHQVGNVKRHRNKDVEQWLESHVVHTVPKNPDDGSAIDLTDCCDVGHGKQATGLTTRPSNAPAITENVSHTRQRVNTGHKHTWTHKIKQRPAKMVCPEVDAQTASSSGKSLQNVLSVARSNQAATHPTCHALHRKRILPAHPIQDMFPDSCQLQEVVRQSRVCNHFYFPMLRM
jgi:hypothetical protein